MCAVGAHEDIPNPTLKGMVVARGDFLEESTL